jgi:GNAT superfamily N-acetyltransferase
MSTKKVKKACKKNAPKQAKPVIRLIDDAPDSPERARIEEIWQRSLPPGGSSPRWVRTLGSEPVIITEVCVVDERVVAFVLYHLYRGRQSHTISLNVIAVDPDERRKGYGTAMIKHLTTDILSGMGHERIFALIPMKNGPALQFFCVQGFEVDEDPIEGCEDVHAELGVVDGHARVQ